MAAWYPFRGIVAQILVRGESDLWRIWREAGTGLRSCLSSQPSIERRKVSGRNSAPITAVAAATTTGYHKP